MSNKNHFLLAANAGNTYSDKALGEEEFLSLLNRSKKGDSGARNQILMANLGLIKTIAKKVASTVEDQREMAVYGCIRFLEIINDYNPSKGKLSTYIWNPLAQAMHESMPGYSKALGKFLRSYNDAVECLLQKLHRKPNEEEIADFLGISVKILRKRLLSLNNRVCASYDAPVSKDDADSASLLEIYVAEESDDAAASVLEREDRKSIMIAWNLLSEDERSILMLRPYEDGHRISLRDAEKITGLSKETIRCRENAAKKHFSSILCEYGVMAA